MYIYCWALIVTVLQLPNLQWEHDLGLWRTNQSLSMVRKYKILLLSTKRHIDLSHLILLLLSLTSDRQMSNDNKCTICTLMFQRTTWHWNWIWFTVGLLLDDIKREAQLDVQDVLNDKCVGMYITVGLLELVIK